MNQIEMEFKNRGIKRLCHFTQSRNLAHIFGDLLGLCSTKTLKKYDMPYTPTDLDRLDGRDDLVCCSIEYPNTFYFDTARCRDKLFKDWVVLMIDPSHLSQPDTEFSPCNASAENGIYIKKGFNQFVSLFAETSQGNRQFQRQLMHLNAVPTNLQAEVLLKGPIPLQSIIGLIFESELQVKREIFRLELQGINLRKPIYIFPECFQRDGLTSLIHQGKKTKLKIYRYRESNGQ